MDLTTRYLGLSLRNPVVAGAGPLTGDLDNVRRLEDLGAGAVVLPSIFEEQIEHEQQSVEQLVAAVSDGYGEALSYFPAQAAYAVGPDHYLELVRRAAVAVDIPVIASLNGITSRGWVDYARQIEEAGAQALELNIYYIASDVESSGRAVEERYLAIVKAVKAAVRLPVAVKIGPYFSSVGDMARQLVRAGADGLVLFNRFYQPDIDLGRLELASTLELSAAYEARLPLLWIGILAGQFKASLAASTGVESVDEIIKYLLAGADVVMTTSSLLRQGIGHMRTLTEDLARWLNNRGLASLDRIRGRMSHRNIADPTAFERGNYIKMLQGYTKAVMAAR